MPSRKAGQLSDTKIRSMIRNRTFTEGIVDGGGLTLRYRPNDSAPHWMLRYRFGGKSRVVHLGSYADVGLAEARETARKLRARITLGFDPAKEKRQRKRSAIAAIEAEGNTVARLADAFVADRVIGHWKYPDIVRSRFERDIKPAIGRMPVDTVRPPDIADLLKKVRDRGAPTIANDVLRWCNRMFNFAIKRELITTNPAAAFDLDDAGGAEHSRERHLSDGELVQLFEAMRTAKGWAYINTLAIKLLLLTCSRKMEVVAAKVDEFDLDAGVWYLPAIRTKTGAALDIPLPRQAVDIVAELVRLADGSAWLLPARKRQVRMLPHISGDTLNAALAKYIRPAMPGVESFSVHDLRRTARTQLAALKINPHVAEKCLNHKIKGVEGVYDRHDYFAERKDALQRLADHFDRLEHPDANVVELHRSGT